MYICSQSAAEESRLRKETLTFAFLFRSPLLCRDVVLIIIIITIRDVVLQLTVVLDSGACGATRCIKRKYANTLRVAQESLHRSTAYAKLQSQDE